MWNFIATVLLSTSSPTPVLWNSGVWPFAQKPWIALLETVGADGFEHRLINLGDKPDEFVNKYREASGNPLASGLVPLLENGDELVIESDVVAKYVAQNFGGTTNDGPIMYPTDETADTIDNFLDTWHPIVDKYYDLLCATSIKSAENRKAIFAESFATLETLLLTSAEGEFLLGGTFSLAECICGPWIQRFFVTLPYFRRIDFEQDILSPYPRVSQWMKAVRERPSVKESKCDEEEMLAAARRYYVSFVNPGAPGRL